MTRKGDIFATLGDAGITVLIGRRIVFHRFADAKIPPGAVVTAATIDRDGMRLTWELGDGVGVSPPVVGTPVGEIPA